MTATTVPITAALDSPPRREESHARTYARHLGVEPVEAQGARLRGGDGRWYIDMLAGAGALSLGHNHPVVVDAVRRVLAEGAPMLTLDLHSPWRDRFVHELLTAMPPKLRDEGVVHLCAPSGAAAIEAALLAAEAATGGVEHVGVQGGYHGCTHGARSVSSGGGLRRNLSNANPVHLLPFPQAYRCPFGVGGDEGVRLAITVARRLLADAASPLVRPASVITEFVLGEGGTLPAPPAWGHALRELTAAAGIPLIADEIQAGICRTGRMWAFEHCDVVPDIVVTSKGLGSGLPIAAIVMHRDLNVWPEGAFTGTFRGNTLAFAAATAVLRHCRTQELAEQVRHTGTLMARRLDELQRSAPVVGEVRSIGLMAGIEIVDPSAEPDERGVLPPASQTADLIRQRCLDNGVIVEIGGAYDNVVRCLPPLVISERDLDYALEVVAGAVMDIGSSPVRPGVRA
jgi:diaminobutyrate-2-oxoglutarate transaminase